MGQGRAAIIWATATACLAGAACAGSGAGAASVSSAAAGPPVPRFAHTVVLRPVSGKVLIDLPGTTSRFVRLSATRTVPVGTMIDTTAGQVRLTSADPAPGQFQTGLFFLGTFRVRQPASGAGLVDLELRDHLTRATCTAPPIQGAAHGAALSAQVLGLLRGVARGRFRTVGRFSAATVRGTNWGVRDRCDGTLTVVRHGVVAVLDFVRHKTVIIRTGQTYLARAPVAKAP